MQPGSRIVVDTNVFVSRAMLPDSIPARALRIVENHHILLASEATMEELTEVLMRAKLAPYIIHQEKEELFARLDTLTEIVPIVHYINVCRDPNALLKSIGLALPIRIRGGDSQHMANIQKMFLCSSAFSIRVANPFGGKLGSIHRRSKLPR